MRLDAEACRALQRPPGCAQAFEGKYDSPSHLVDELQVAGHARNGLAARRWLP